MIKDQEIPGKPRVKKMQNTVWKTEKHCLDVTELHAEFECRKIEIAI